MALAHALGELTPAVEARLRRLSDDRVVERIWERDHTVWRDDPTEISNRLGWLDAPERSRDEVAELERFASEVAAEGFTDAVLLGMGGSSLAPEVISRSFGTRDGMLRLSVLDTTHPDEIALLERRIDRRRTLFLVASKSGTTIETRSHMAYFLDRVGDPARFVAITDPGTPLEDDARRHGFRKVFHAPADVGGRYSALTVFGLLPAALIGADLDTLLKKAADAAAACRRRDPVDNPGAWLGAVLGEAVLAGRDKLTFDEIRAVADYAGMDPTQLPSLAALGPWLEQLFAESTGKDGTGIVPVDGEPPARGVPYEDDRLFLSLMNEAARPSVVLPYHEPEHLGHAFFTLEFATAVAGHVLAIQPFDQPNVQEAKDRTAEVLASGHVPEEPPTPVDDLLSTVRPGDYVALQAFVPQRGDLFDALQAVRTRIRDRFPVATTLGIGPRYLHSTGQLHKGGPDTGVFLQVFADPTQDREIPGEPYTFGGLIAAQAAGDLAALRSRGRRAGRVGLEELLGWAAELRFP